MFTCFKAVIVIFMLTIISGFVSIIIFIKEKNIFDVLTLSGISCCFVFGLLILYLCINNIHKSYEIEDESSV